jgi:hypothetical protein
MAVTMRTALVGVLRRGKPLDDTLDPSDRGFLELWVEGYADDPVWAVIVADARALGCWPTKNLYSQLVWYVLDARRLSLNVKEGIASLLQREQKERERILSLADMADNLALYFEEVAKFSGIAAFFQRNLTLPVTPEQAKVFRVEPPLFRVKQLRDLHKREAELLRKRAGSEPKPRIFVSRKRKNRDLVAFIHLMSNCLRDFCGDEHRGAVALLADLAFGKGTVKEDVRKTLARQ